MYHLTVTRWHIILTVTVYLIQSEHEFLGNFFSFIRHKIHYNYSKVLWDTQEYILSRYFRKCWMYLFLKSEYFDQGLYIVTIFYFSHTRKKHMTIFIELLYFKIVQSLTCWIILFLNVAYLATDSLTS